MSDTETAGPGSTRAGTDGAARAAALEAARSGAATATSLVDYRSEGRLLIAGPEAKARAAAERLSDAPLTISLLITDAGAPDAAGGPGQTGQAQTGEGQGAPAKDAAAQRREIRAPLAAVRGHLGAFEVDVDASGEVRPLAPSILTGNQPYDIVLDLGEAPVIAAQVPPPGYYAPAASEESLEAALSAIPDLVGEFEKPRYFNYNPDICAHGARGQRGCTRCLDACPTDAIVSIGERIEVSPYLCQGGGVCATACPTGAITYAYPPASNLVDRLRAMFAAFREAGGGAPVLLLHDGEAGHAWLEAHRGSLPEPVLPFAVEEVGSVGLEVWLAALAFGASRVLILATAATPASVRATVTEQMAFAEAIVTGLGHAPDSVQVVEAESGELPAASLADLESIPGDPGTFAGVDDKRAALRLALDDLYGRSEGAPAELALPAGGPFGEIHVNPQTCTLCMACVAVCPAGAVISPGDAPRLDFIEQNCVQCGLCDAACPEDAIELVPRLLLDRERRAARRVLNEDQPFACVSCGKVFGSTRTIEKMVEKLAGHWMFQDKPEQMERLRMCEDCRVKDMFKDGGGLLDPEPPRH